MEIALNDHQSYLKLGGQPIGILWVVVKSFLFGGGISIECPPNSTWKWVATQLRFFGWLFHFFDGGGINIKWPSNATWNQVTTWLGFFQWLFFFFVVESTLGGYPMLLGTKILLEVVPSFFSGGNNIVFFSIITYVFESFN